MSEVLSPPVRDEPSGTGVVDQAANSPESSLTQKHHWSKRSLLTVIGWIPSTLVVGGLIALAWFGHHNDWKLPSFGSMSADAESQVEWCDSHGVAESDCINCVIGLVADAPDLTFCKVHGVHGCVLENPSLAQTRQPAEVLPRDLERAERALAIQPRRENLELSKLPGTRVQFASVEAMTKAGVDVEPVERRAFTESVSVAGEVVYDATQMALVSPAADGVVRQVKVNVGDWVSAGDVLAVVDSQKVGELKSDLLSALLAEDLAMDQFRRLAKLAKSQATSKRELIEGKSDLQQASVAVEQAVRGFVNLGLQVDLDSLRSMSLSESKVAIRKIGMDAIETTGGSANLIAVIAPLEGRVVNRDAVTGEVVDRGSLMFRIADTRSVWLDLRVPAEEASLAKIGLPIRYRPDGSSREHRGEVTWISSDVDPQTRTVRVRAELANDDGELRNESFGHGEIVLRDETDAIAVPESAIQWDGENSLVFVRDAKFFDDERPKFFIARSVRTGVSQDGFTEIIAGVLPGEVVATSGSDVLRAQLLKNNLGAGCTCGH